MRNYRNKLKHLVLATSCFAALSCAKTAPKKSAAPVTSKTEESSTKDVETAEFTGKASDGRLGFSICKPPKWRFSFIRKQRDNEVLALTKNQDLHN